MTGKKRAAAAATIRRSRLVYLLSKHSVLLWARVWLRLSIENRDRVPATGPVLLVANHSSYLDPPLMGITVRRTVHFLAQAGLARFAIARWWFHQMGVTLIDRDAPSKDAMRIVAATLEAEGCVGLFPEGTRSRDGTVGPFRSGIEFLVRRSGATVVPIGLDGAFRALPRGKLFPRPRKVTVRYGEPWAADRVLAPGGIEALRREVAALARTPLRGESRGDGRVDQGSQHVPADPSAL